MSLWWTLHVRLVDAGCPYRGRFDVQHSIKIMLLVRAAGRQAETMTDRIALQSKLLVSAIAQRDTPPWRKMSKKELAEMFDPCRWREPVYAWLLANHAKVIRARQHRNGWNGLHWQEIARIMELEGIKGSRGDPPNANSVRRVWGRVCDDMEKQKARKEKLKEERRNRQ